MSSLITEAVLVLSHEWIWCETALDFLKRETSNWIIVCLNSTFRLHSPQKKKSLWSQYLSLQTCLISQFCFCCRCFDGNECGWQLLGNIVTHSTNLVWLNYHVGWHVSHVCASLCPVAIIRLDVTFREFSFGLFYWIWETWNIPNNIQHVSSEMVLRRGKLLFWMLSSTVYKFMTSAWYVH